MGGLVLPEPPGCPLVLPPPNTGPVPTFPLPVDGFPGTLPVLLCPELLLPRPKSSQDKDGDELVLPAELPVPLDTDDDANPKPGELLPPETGLFKLVPAEPWFSLDPKDPTDDPKDDRLFPLSAGLSGCVPLEPRVDPNTPGLEGLLFPEPTLRLGFDLGGWKIELIEPAPADPG